MISHGSVFYGPIYTMFYQKPNFKNIFSLLPPFSLKGWIVLLANSYLVALVLWLLNINNVPFFWLFTVILEQNDDQTGKVSKSSLPMILAWLYVALVLRQAYTSNLYDYMTFEKTSSNLPESFEEYLMSKSPVLLSTLDAINQVHEYRKGIDLYGISNGSSAKHMAEIIIQKYWDMESFEYYGPYSNFRLDAKGVHEICDITFATGNVKESTCTKVIQFAYMTVSGKISRDESYMLETGKFILSLVKSLEMFENSDKHIFRNTDFIATPFENYLKFKFERHLASFMEAGLDLVYNTYKSENGMKGFVSKHVKIARQITQFFDILNVTDRTLLSYLSYWIQNKCFRIYSKEKCDVQIFQAFEIPVKLGDLYAVWVLFSVLLLLSTLSLSLELLRL